MSNPVLLLPDAGPLITLAYAQSLHLLQVPGWRLALVDMVLHEVTRHPTPTRTAIQTWLQAGGVEVMSTQTFKVHQANTPSSTPSLPATVTPSARKANLGEFALQECITRLALEQPHTTPVLLFEDHRIARSSFVLPPGGVKISTRAWLTFLEDKGFIPSAAAVERAAIQAGRQFATLRFPPN